MSVNPYDNRKVSLRRPHGNGDLDIVGASYTRRKANVTEALFRSFLNFIHQTINKALVRKQRRTSKLLSISDLKT